VGPRLGDLGGKKCWGWLAVWRFPKGGCCAVGLREHEGIKEFWFSYPLVSGDAKIAMVQDMAWHYNQWPSKKRTDSVSVRSQMLLRCAAGTCCAGCRCCSCMLNML
jgi:hypothetical protein